MPLPTVEEYIQRMGFPRDIEMWRADFRAIVHAEMIALVEDTDNWEVPDA